MANFFVGDFVEFFNPSTSTSIRTKISHSSESGAVVLDGVSSEWLNPEAVKQYVKLIYRAKEGDQVEYFSNTQKTWQETEITKTRFSGTAGEFQISAKPGMWFTLVSQSIRVIRDLPIPESPGSPRAKRLDTGTRTMEVALTPGAASTALDSSLLLPSTQAGPCTQMPTGPTSAPLGPHATSDDFWSKFDSKMSVHIAGFEERLGQRLDVHDERLDVLEKNDETQNAEIASLKTQMAKIEATISTKMAGLTLSSQTKHKTEKEAFLSGFANLPKNALKTKAEQFIGKPPGFVEVSVPGNVGSHVFIIFDTAEHMETFVVDNNQRAEAAGLRLKHNMPPGTPEEKARRHTIWLGKQKLIEALSLPEKSERVVFSRRRFWLVAENQESVAEMGKLEGDDKIVWDHSAPEPLRSGA